jgi:hypothetical protein
MIQPSLSNWAVEQEVAVSRQARERTGGRAKGAWCLLWAGAVGLCLFLYLASAWFMELNQDEGWYLYAGLDVARGRLPFIDFASTQGPFMSIFYALAAPFVRVGGVLGGRLFTAGLGLLSVAATAWLATELTPRRQLRPVVSLVAFLLTGASLYQVSFTTMVKTYALTSLLLTVALALAVRAWRSGKLWPAAGAGAAVALAACTRSSALLAAPAIGVALLVLLRRRSVGLPRWSWLAFGVGGCAIAGVLVLPFAVQAWPAFKFGLIEYHAGRDVGDLTQVLLYKAGFLIRFAGAYGLTLALLVASVAIYWVQRRCPARPTGRGLDEILSAPRLMVVGAFSLVTLVHLAAPFPYDDYQVMIFPALAALVAALLVDVASPLSPSDGGTDAGVPRWASAGVCALLVVSALLAVSSPILQGWFIGPRDRIWWPMRSEASVATLRRAAAQLRERGGEAGEQLLTQDVYLAVEAGMRVPRGLEMGPFAYCPGLSDREARERHVVNHALLVEVIKQSEAPLAAFSGYGFAIAAPAIVPLPVDEEARLWDTLETIFEHFGTVDDFGQGATSLQLFSRRATAPVGNIP